MNARFIALFLVFCMIGYPAMAVDDADARALAAGLVADEINFAISQTRTLEGIVVGIDPGHQAKADREQEPIAPGSKKTKNRCSSGTRGIKSGIPEYELNLTIAFQLRDMLEADGATVIMTRTTHDVRISNIERTKIMNEANVDLYLRLHCDGSTDEDKNGIAMFVRETGSKKEESALAGNLLLDWMARETGANKRRVNRSDNYTGNNWATVPTVLVEMGFMTNAKEEAKLLAADYQTKLCTGMLKAVYAFVGR